MKKYIHDILNDLKLTAGSAKQQPVPEDLDNQILAKDPRQRVRQLDQQAQQSEERQSLG